ncbi:MAG: hypothetical protein KGJ02_03525 [Verrucomicrobiota bacterium]|nr:hypothetical protein [Verrucomicrobiota bacterium]
MRLCIFFCASSLLSTALPPIISRDFPLDPLEFHSNDPNEFHFPEPIGPSPVPMPPSPPAASASLDAHVLFDLETRTQDFVLDVKRIEIPNFPGAFNPSIVRWDGKFLMSFRIRERGEVIDKFGVIYLDEEFNSIGEAQTFEFRPNNPYFPSKLQDPRLVVIANRLYVVFSNVLEGPYERDIRRMYIAGIHANNGKFILDRPTCLSRFPGENELTWEKNWAPFDYQGIPYFVHSILPHRILRPIPWTNACELVTSTRGAIQWDWGALRGGTPPILVGGEYLAFFHSSRNIPTVHSNGRNRQHYFMGAYTFSAHPPFAITRISPEPIIGKNFYHGLAYKTWKPLHVVFPCGFVFDDKYFWVVYGRQDFENWVVKIDKQALLNSLIPVATAE